jgi:undecaprenyl-diphosphatase
VHRLGHAVGSSSFPSGHATTAFACATMLAAFAPRLRVPLFALAALIALSRLYNGDHYPLDVLAGAALGTATAAILLKTSRRL